MCCICLADIKPIGINSIDINHVGLKHIFIYKACSYAYICVCGVFCTGKEHQPREDY